MIKKGINIWSYPSDTTLKDVFKISAEAGFEGVELSLMPDGHCSIKSTEQELLSVKKMAEDFGLKIPSFASNLAWDNPITSNDAKTRIRGIEYLKKQIEVASILGADTILLVPGYVGVDFIPNSEIVLYTDAYERAIDAISEAVEIAQKCKVAIGIENVWNKFLLSPIEMRDFVDKFKSEYVGVYFDVGNVIATGYAEQWINILGKRIKKLHFKDFRKSVGTLSGFVDLLAGDVNYPAVVTELESIGYDSFCTAEMIPPYTHYPHQIIYNTSKSMDAILKRK